MKDKWSDFLVYNKGWVRWNYPNGELIIFSDNVNKSDEQITKIRCSSFFIFLYKKIKRDNLNKLLATFNVEPLTTLLMILELIACR